MVVSKHQVRNFIRIVLGLSVSIQHYGSFTLFPDTINGCPLENAMKFYGMNMSSEDFLTRKHQSVNKSDALYSLDGRIFKTVNGVDKDV